MTEAPDGFPDLSDVLDLGPVADLVQQVAELMLGFRRTLIESGMEAEAADKLTAGVGPEFAAWFFAALARSGSQESVAE